MGKDRRSKGQTSYRYPIRMVCLNYGKHPEKPKSQHWSTKVSDVFIKSVIFQERFRLTRMLTASHLLCRYRISRVLLSYLRLTLEKVSCVSQQKYCYSEPKSSPFSILWKVTGLQVKAMAELLLKSIIVFQTVSIKTFARGIFVSTLCGM